ncbi:MAG: hypothetical protein PHD88_07135 [Firmicutes bacterium]|nr:hypothetical protein [Bacillota bacterium]MDD4694155.1 hypothetical protein [Bacillota bacterium]
MQEYLLLLGTNLRIWFTSAFKAKSKKKAIMTVVGYLFLVAFAIGWTWLSYDLFKGLRGIFEEQGLLLETGNVFVQTALLTVSQILSLASILFLLLTGLRIIYEYLFDSPDMHFLLATPLKVRNIFAAKFTECLALIFISISFMTLAPMIGLGIAFRGGFTYYLTTIISFVAGFVLFGSLSALLLLLIMRYVPGQRLKQILLSATLVMGIVIVIISQTVSSSLMDITEEQIISALSGLGDLGINNLSYLPHVWIAKSSVATLPGSSVNLWANLIPLLIVAGLFFWLTISLSAKLFLSGFAAGTETDTLKKKKKTNKVATVNDHKVGNPFGAMLKKELIYFKREPMMWYQLAIGLIVMGFYAFNTSRVTPSPEEAQMMPDLVNQSVSLFMIVLFAGLSGPNTAGLSLSREGKNWRFLQSLPVEPKTVYWSKFIFGAVPCVLEGLIGVFLFHFLPGTPMFPLYISIPVVIGALLGLVALDVWTDIYFPNFNIKIGSSKSSEGTGKILFVNLATMPIIVLLGATFTFSLWYDSIGIFSGLSEIAVRTIAVSLFTLETLGVFFVCSKASVKRLKLLLVGAIDAKGA